MTNRAIWLLRMLGAIIMTMLVMALALWGKV